MRLRDELGFRTAGHVDSLIKAVGTPVRAVDSVHSTTVPQQR